MSDFVDDNTDLAIDKIDKKHLTTEDPREYIVALDWIALCQAAYDLRGKVQSLLSDTGALDATGLPDYLEIASNDAAVSTAGKARLKYFSGKIAASLNHGAYDNVAMEAWVTQAISDAISGSGDDWEPYDTDIIQPSGSVHSTILIENDATPRDDPKAVAIFRNEGLSDNPMFALGNPYIAGVGLPAMGVSYTDDTLAGETVPWRLCYSWEKSGTFATVLDGVARSAYESFTENGQYKPWMRIEKSSQAINFGAATRSAPGQVSRAANVVTVNTVNDHKFAVGDQLWRTTDPYDGDVSDLTLFGAESGGSPSFTVSVVVDANTFKYNDTGSNGTSVGGILYSKETDVSFGRDATNVAAIRVNGSSVVKANALGLAIPGGLSILAENPALPIGAEGVASVEATADMLHILEGKTFYNEGTYKSTGWFNGGGETQTTQEVFIVATGAGDQVTNLRQISGIDWIRLLVKNDGQGGSHTLTVTPHAGDTVGGASTLVLPANAAATLVAIGTDWEIFYHPPPP